MGLTESIKVIAKNRGDKESRIHFSYLYNKLDQIICDYLSPYQYNLVAIDIYRHAHNHCGPPHFPVGLVGCKDKVGGEDSDG